MSMDERQQFDKDGYLLVRDVFTAEQAGRLREFFLAQFNLPPEQLRPGDTDSSLVNIFCRYPEMRWLLFNERVVVEGAAAVGVAALLSGRLEVDAPVCVVLTGRNVSASVLQRIVAAV